ncbi:major capsid protein [Microviridae sp.]|nr:major capsid protein [Microviridae sp.]
MKSIMTPQEIFNKVSKPKIQRSTFDRSHGYKTTFDAGKLIPFYCDEALPGDTFKMSTSVFGRLATPIKPIMDNVMIDIHFFSVPLRLVWDNFQKFMGEQVDPGDSIDYLMPTMTPDDHTGGVYPEASNFDYLGIPTKVGGFEHRADFLRAMHLIWNEWYRDENLQDSLVVDKGDGPDSPDDYSALLTRGKRKDYFTGALPFAQKGDPVTIPFGTSAPITGLAVAGVPSTGPLTGILETDGTGTTSYANYWGVQYAEEDPNNTGFPNIRADLSEASAQTINLFREAASIQKLLERDARGGTRYTEIIYSHFGVQSLDSRLQRPEYLGGGTSNLNVSSIAQTSESGGASTPQGNLAAMGVFSDVKNGFIKSFTEHEIIIGFMSARADLNYQQGLNKMWSRSTRYDHYFPEFAHLGEQSVLNKEIYTQGTTADEDVFGYQERFAEYRYKPSMVTGLFRSNAATSLDVWHLSQDFASLPALNDSFIQENPPIDRVIAVPSEPQFIVDMYLDLKCTRPMPVVSIPGIDTF